MRLDEDLDKYFKIDFLKTEVSTRDDAYSGLEMQALSTSYLDYYQILKDLGADKVLVDLGAGHGRGSFLAQELQYHCLSVEYEKSRIEHLQRTHKESAIYADMLAPNFKLPDGDAYFLYLPWGELSNLLMRKIQELSQSKILYIIESHGDFIENLSLYGELLTRQELPLQVSTPRHCSDIVKLLSRPLKYQQITLDSYRSTGSIAHWCLKFGRKVRSITVKTKSSVGSHLWEANFEGSYCCLYQGRPSLYIASRKRFLQFQYDTIEAIVFH